MRKTTLQKLIKYLRASGATSVLELGCGNGWLSYNLSNSLNAEICAVDVNETELRQAGRVFNGKANLCFLYTNIFSRVLKPKHFDAIVLGSSIQYFEDLENLFTTLLDLLRPSGSIYIVIVLFITMRRRPRRLKTGVSNTLIHWDFQPWPNSIFIIPLKT